MNIRVLHLLVSVVIFTLSTCLSIAQTHIKTVNQYGVWSKKQSPYLLDTNIMVPKGKVLVIEPGVRVISSGRFVIEVQGQLLAAATANDSISFSASDYTIGWKGIHFIADSAAIMPDSSKLIFCKIEYVNNSSGAIFIKHYSHLLIEQSVIADNNVNYTSKIGEDVEAAGAGMVVYAADPVISLCSFNYNTVNTLVTNQFYASASSRGGGLFCYGGASPSLYNNIFSNNSCISTSFYNFGLSAGAGAYFATGSNPVLSGNIFKNNKAEAKHNFNGTIVSKSKYAYAYGSAIYLEGNNYIEFRGNTITNNRTYADAKEFGYASGGGVYIGANANGFVQSNVLTNNVVSSISWDDGSYGGGIFFSTSCNIVLESNIINNNSVTSKANANGGGLFFAENSTILLIDNQVSNNLVTGALDAQGGGVYCHKPFKIQANRNRFDNNSLLSITTPEVKGGAIYVDNSTDLLFTNNTFCYNTIAAEPQYNNKLALAFGGAICLESVQGAVFNNNTVCYNTTTAKHKTDSQRLAKGGGFCFEASTATLTNTIVYGNTALHGEQIYTSDIEKYIRITNCNIPEGINQIACFNDLPFRGIIENMLVSAPLFDDKSKFDFEPRDNSPTIDAGKLDTTGLLLGNYDAGFSFRVNQSRIDIGAYEYTNFSPTGLTLTSNRISPNLSKGTVIGMFKAEDRNEGDIFEFELVENDTTDNVMFRIDNNNLKIESLINFKEKQRFVILVKCTDGRGGEAFTSFSIVQNQLPTFSLSNNEVIENEVGVKIGYFIVVDADDKTHNIRFTKPNDVDNAFFMLKNDSLFMKQSFDYEVKSEYTISVECNDGNSGIVVQLFNVSVLNQNEPPSDLQLNHNLIIENQPKNSFVGKLKAIDQDYQQPYQFKLLKGDGVNDIDNPSFFVRHDSLFFNNTANYEKLMFYKLFIEADDKYGNKISKGFTVIVVDANDAPSNVIISSDTISEFRPAGTLVGRLKEIDEDGNDKHSFALSADSLGNNYDNQFFYISHDSLFASETFNYNNKKSYLLNIKVIDAKGESMNRLIFIWVNDAPSNSINSISDYQLISIAPNPTDGIFKIITSPNNKELRVEIVDSYGTIQFAQFFKNQENMLIDLSRFASGLYYVICTSGNAKHTKTIVVY